MITASPTNRLANRLATICQRLFRPTLFVLIIVQLVSCGSDADREDKPANTAEVDDLFPVKSSIDYAQGFSLTYHDTYKLIQIYSPFETSSDTATYVLLPRGQAKPPGYADGQIIEIPVQRLVTMSSMHLGLLGFLQAEDILIGMGDLKYVSSPKILNRIKEEKIVAVGRDQMLNEELLVAMHPGLIMAMGSPVSKIGQYHGLREAGIPVMVNSEWLETSPLARAEWVKLMAALLNKEAEVNTRFGAVAKEYHRLSALAKGPIDRPSVLCGLHSRDTWYVPDGDSYMYQYIRDAGGSYHWAHIKATGSLPLSFEQVYPVGLKADFWINVGSGNIENRSDLLAKDGRYADFKAFQRDRVYAFTKRVNDRGANDYWESGAVNPQVILADLIKILHPEVLPDHELFYYKPIQ